MENIIFSANIILPLLVMMIIGSISKKVGLLNDGLISDGNNLVFKIFLPLTIFCNVYSSDFASLNTAKLFIFVAVMITLSFIVSTIIAMVTEKQNSRRGVMIQGLARTNYAMLGIPLLGLLFEGQDIALGSLLVAIVIPLYNIYSVTALTYFGSPNTNIKSIIKGIVTNPLIIASMVALFMALTGIKLPEFLYDGIYDIGSIATPFALFLLGATFEFKSIKRVFKPLSIVLAGRLVVFPSIILWLGAMLGFTGVEMGCILITFASPTAATSYTMAVKMGGDGELASSIVIFTSILCTLSFFVFILALKTFALI